MTLTRRLALAAGAGLALPAPGRAQQFPSRAVRIIDRLRDWVAYTPLQNVTGEPAISLPLAESAAGMPVGMMLAADIGREARLLQLAYELEEAQPWRRIHD